MNLLTKMVNKIRRIFGLETILTQPLLNEGLCDNENGIMIRINEKKVSIKEDKKGTELSVAKSDSVSSISENVTDKERFFRMYSDYKLGKINEDYLTITDLIDLELMLLEEEKILNNKILEEQEIIEKQEKQIYNLNAIKEKEKK